MRIRASGKGELPFHLDRATHSLNRGNAIPFVSIRRFVVVRDLFRIVFVGELVYRILAVDG